MKNLKKVLALVLVVATLMGLATVAGAKMSYDYEDAASIKDERIEAVDVMSTLGVFQGTSNNFNPEGILTREEAAKIICYMVLTKEEADKLVANVAPYNDVPRDRWSAGPIGYCKSQGIIAGVGNGNYNPTGQLTGLQFAKMLLTALGYDAEVEGLTGSQWGINTSKLAIAEAKIADGVTSAELEAPLSRQDACQLAFNTLEANMQEYLFKHSDYTTPHQSCLNNNGDYRNVGGDNALQFCEKYFPKLTQRDTVDVFGRPSHEWRYDAQKIDNYVEWDKMIQEWTVKVTGKMVYDVVGSTIIKDYTSHFHVDGETDKDILGDAFFDKGDLVSNNKDKIGLTGKGVLTQVFQDNDTKELYVTVINTYLVKATEDYDTKNEDVNVNIYELGNKGSSSAPIFVKTRDTKTSYTIEKEDLNVEEVKKDDIYICNVADGKVQYMWTPETLSEKVVVNFKKGDFVTSDGTQYDYADTVMYDEEVLDAYDDANMKDVTYNIILDDYGYLIGIERNEDPDQYLFLTGLDGSNSNIYAKRADANVIFMDGTMKTVKVDLDKSDFDEQTYSEKTGYTKNLSQLNTWCKYSVSSSDVYTLTEVKVATTADPTDTKIDGEKVKVAQYWQDVETQPNNIGSTDEDDRTKKSIDTKHVSLNGSYYRDNDDKEVKTLVYGNDATVYLNVSMKKMNVDDNSYGGSKRWIIDDVETVTTGIKDTKISVEAFRYNSDYPTNTYDVPDYEIYTLYDDKGYIKAVVTIGEDEGTSSNYVFVSSKDTKLEAYATDTDWTWSREVITKTGKTDITENGESRKFLGPNDMKRGDWYEVKYGADGHVRDADSVEDKINDGTTDDGFINSVEDLEKAINSDKSTVVLADRANANGLTYKNGTLYLTQKANRGIYINPDVKTVLITADKKANAYDSIEDSYEGRDGLEKAMKDMNVDSDDFNERTVEIHAIVEGSNGAVLVIINDLNRKTDASTSSGTSSKRVGPGHDEPGYDVNKSTREIFSAFMSGASTASRRSNIVSALSSAGYTALKVDLEGAQAMDNQGRYWYINEIELVPIKVNGTVKTYATRAYVDGEPDTNAKFNIPENIKLSDKNSTYYKTTVTVDGVKSETFKLYPADKDGNITNVHDANSTYKFADDTELFMYTTGYVNLSGVKAGVTVDKDDYETDTADKKTYVKANTKFDVTFEETIEANANKTGTVTLTVTTEKSGDKTYEASARADKDGKVKVEFTVAGVTEDIIAIDGNFNPTHELKVNYTAASKNALKKAQVNKTAIGSENGTAKLTLTIVGGDELSEQTYSISAKKIEKEGVTFTVDESQTTTSMKDFYKDGVLTIGKGNGWNGSVVLTVSGVTNDTEIVIERTDKNA